MNCKPEPPENQERYISAPSGLVLRAEAGKNGEKIQVLRQGSMVLLTGEKGRSETIAGRPGAWVEITAGGKTGWVFNAHLKTKEKYDQTVIPPKFIYAIAAAFQKYGNWDVEKVSGIENPPLGLKIKPKEYMPFSALSILSHEAFCIMAWKPGVLLKHFNFFQTTTAKYYNQVKRCASDALGYEIIDSVHDVTYNYSDGSREKWAVVSYNMENVRRFSNSFRIDQDLKVHGVRFQTIYDTILKDIFRSKVIDIHQMLTVRNQFDKYRIKLEKHGADSPYTDENTAFPTERPYQTLSYSLFTGGLFPLIPGRYQLDESLFSFLIRRDADGTLDFFLAKLNEIMDAYDPEFAREKRFL
ncbi:MAG: SH3 domain-containing protein [Spirochaetia bacterium]|nr:SH3 domain-containing protein [Spirochaetia bacterium]